MNIAEKIFLVNLGQMKDILELGEFKFGKDSDEYKFFKKKTMDIFYKNISGLFVDLAEANILKRCNCNSTGRNGYTDCSTCHGSGWENKNN